MKFLIVIPAHNEEENIIFCLKSLEAQTFRDFKVVVVNDGSTDETAKLTEDFIFNLNENQPEKFRLINLKKSAHEPGAKVVRTFNNGIENETISHFDVICKFDADIIFPPSYLEKINRIYEQNPKAGMVSGIVKINKDAFDKTEIFDFSNEKKEWQFENISSKNHVRGPIKSYRRECFSAMNGLRPVLGWDNIDVMLTQMNGFEVITIKNLWVKHLRPTAFKYKNQKAEKLGEYFYNIGLNFPLAAISSAKSSFKNRSPQEFFVTMKSFLKQKSPRELSEKEIKFIRNLRWRPMLKRK